MHNGPRGPKMDKSKDFVGSMKRLFKELKSFQILIAMALIFAILSSVLSIAAPNKLSKLTDAISEGLIVNVDEMQEISKKTTNNLQNINPQEIMKSTNLSVEEKTNFMMVMQSSDKDNMLALKMT